LVGGNVWPELDEGLDERSTGGKAESGKDGAENGGEVVGTKFGVGGGEKCNAFGVVEDGGIRRRVGEKIRQEFCSLAEANVP
jgi:hypothetical protein